jgi:hypothetical protein
MRGRGAVAWLSSVQAAHTIARQPHRLRCAAIRLSDGPAMIDESFDDVTNLQKRLDQLRVEHRDLDDAIARLTASQLDDELLIRRLKKRKLALKDRITVIERMLEPDERA